MNIVHIKFEMASVNKEKIRMAKEEVGIFGFGSLLSISSLERTLRRDYKNPSCPCTVSGWQRRWNVTEPNEGIYAISPTGRFFPRRIVYLNIEPAADLLLNGLLVFIKKRDLSVMDRRENVYNRIEITHQINEYDVEGGPIYTYEGKEQHLAEEIHSPREAALQQSYLDTIEEALKRLGPSFREQYQKSTEEVPQHLVVRDRLAG